MQSASSPHPARQADAPSHQVTPHSPEGSFPPGTGVHVPTAPATTQDSQRPAQEVSQHTPSAQKPESHWSARWHAPPTANFPAQAPWTHAMPGLHSEDWAQEGSHAGAVPLQ